MRFSQQYQPLLLILGGIASVDAFWRTNCQGQIANVRIDPIADYGKPGGHVHNLHGSNAITFTSDRSQLRNDLTCSSCDVSQDKSAYWTPSLYFAHDNGTFQLVPGGTLTAYYLLYPPQESRKVEPFPTGFRMLAGDTNLRKYIGPANGADDGSQESLQAHSIGFNCLGITPAEGSLERHYLPDKSFIDQCKGGLRLEIRFPSCWDGKNVTTTDYKSHVRYAKNKMGDGDCPPGFEQRLPMLFYETEWNTQQFIGDKGYFVVSNGDRTGYGYHADFLEGWDEGILQKAIQDPNCNNPSGSGKTQDCPVFNKALVPEQTYLNCKIKSLPDAISKENTQFSNGKLPGNVNVTGHSGGSSTGIGTDAGDSSNQPQTDVSSAPVGSSATSPPTAVDATATPGMSSSPVTGSAASTPDIPASPDTGSAAPTRGMPSSTATGAAKTCSCASRKSNKK